MTSTVMKTNLLIKDKTITISLMQKTHKDKALGIVNPPSAFYGSIVHHSNLVIPYLRLKIDDPITTKSLSQWSFGSMYIYEINYL